MPALSSCHQDVSEPIERKSHPHGSETWGKPSWLGLPGGFDFVEVQGERTEAHDIGVRDLAD